MPQFPGKAIIEALDKLTAENSDGVESSLLEVASELLDTLSEFIATLEKNRLGTIKASVANLKAITRFKSQLTAVMQSGSYGNLAKELAGAFTDVTTLTNQYFSLISEGFTVTDFYKEIRRQNIETTVTTLLEGGMEANYVAPITKVLQQSVTGQMSSKQAINTVSELVADTGQPARWVKVYADDSLNQFSRNYTQAISDDLDLSHFLYSGTQIDSTRTFCKSKVGNVYTKAEVQAWVKEQWSGKNPATNAGNIEIYLGGYRCRHRLVPITQSAYEAIKDE